MSATIRIGQIVGAFGIKGQVKVKPLTDFLERFEPGRRLRLNGDWVTLDDVAEHKGSLIVTLAGVEDRTRAEALQWAYLEAVGDEPPELEEDEYMTQDLIGLKAVDPLGQPLGTVLDVKRYPAHDILIVDGTMVPAVAEFVESVDLESGTIVLKPIPGMFGEEGE